MTQYQSSSDLIRVAAGLCTRLFGAMIYGSSRLVRHGSRMTKLVAILR